VSMTKIARTMRAGPAFTPAPSFTMTGMAEDYLASRGGDNAGRHPPSGAWRCRIVAEMPPSAPRLRPHDGGGLTINGASYVH
jgi:hypothetical protein